MAYLAGFLSGLVLAFIMIAYTDIKRNEHDIAQGFTILNGDKYRLELVQ